MDITLKEARVLAIEDDADILTTYATIFEASGAHFSGAATLQDGLRLAATRPFEVLLLDRSIGYDSGVAAIPQIRAHAPSLRIIMATAHRDADAAMEALRLGAHDYLVKPFSTEQLRIAVLRQLEAHRLTDRVEALETERPKAATPIVVSESALMNQTLGLARQVAGTDANVLILGESGTGKNVLARYIHDLSPRREHNLGTVNCPSLSPDLLENELFGHRKGAFTGANESAEGRVAKVDGGTLFLDEIGDFPLALQPKLLRFIQDKQYERVGDPTTRRADVRIIAATNRDLAQMVSTGHFRQDLYYRIHVVALTLPALRERREDIEALAKFFLRRYARDYGRPAREFSAEANAALLAYGWPGNVRELQNVIERAVILANERVLDRAHLSLDIHARQLAPMPGGVIASAGDAPAPATTPLPSASSSLPAPVTAPAPTAAGQMQAAELDALRPASGSAADDLPTLPPAAGLICDADGAPLSIDALERRQIAAALEHSRTLEEASRWLGIDASTLYRKRKALGLP